MTSPVSPSFAHTGDGWYMIEPRGQHPNAAAGIVQVIDEPAVQSIVSRFNADAAVPNFPGMLVDHEHFSHDADKETRAFGWLDKLQGRPDGIYGRIRWTDTGRAAVDGGDYRFFSTEYDARDLVPVANRTPKPHGSNGAAVRPVRLAGLTLTNKPNNKGGKPITNRAECGRPGQMTPSAAADEFTRLARCAMIHNRISFEKAWELTRQAEPLLLKRGLE